MIMKYPLFFNNIESIKLIDPLAQFLGAIEDGIIEFSYLDIVKSAGHSCPTVAGAYLMALYGLKELFKDQLPIRGEIMVSFKEKSDEGVAGVISNVISQITGATQNSGFKGINGKFARDKLIRFEEPIDSDIKLTRTDTDKSVEVFYDPSVIPPDPRQKELMEKISNVIATEDEHKLFQTLWQKRVEDIFNNIDKVITIK